MRDKTAREEIAELKVRVEVLSKALDKVDDGNFDLRDFKRKFMEVVKELGWSFDEDGILDSAADINSSLGRLQAQISALVDVLGYKETYVGGKLRYEKGR